MTTNNPTVDLKIKLADAVLAHHKCLRKRDALDPSARIDRRAVQHEIDAAARALEDAIIEATKGESQS